MIVERILKLVIKVNIFKYVLNLCCFVFNVMLIKNWSFIVNLIIFFEERFVYYIYLVKKEKF